MHEGVTKNISTAISWYEKSAKQGFEEAKKKLKELKYATYGSLPNEFEEVLIQS